jgi:hypothetical protein
MMITNSDEAAVAMREVAERASTLAKAVMMAEVERLLPDDDPKNEARQVGAMITACSMMYGDMLKACVNDGSKVQAILVAGMLKNFCADGLAKLARIAGSESGVHVFKA